MRFEPDILVEVPGTTKLLLVVEVKLRGRTTDPWRAQLFQFMRGEGCTRGMFVTLDEVAFFRDHYLGDEPGDLEVHGPFPLGGLFSDFQGPSDAVDRGFAFEDRVQAWLEELVSGRLDGRLPAPTRAFLSAEILPILWGTDVRAGSPRYRESA
jgi:hypothetical protein